MGGPAGGGGWGVEGGGEGGEASERLVSRAEIDTLLVRAIKDSGLPATPAMPHPGTSPAGPRG